MLTFEKFTIRFILLIWMIAAESQGHHVALNNTLNDENCGSQLSIAAGKYPW